LKHKLPIYWEKFINNNILIIYIGIWEVNDMKNKLITIFVSMLFISLTFSITVIAGSEEDPEIIDELDEELLH